MWDRGRVGTANFGSKLVYYDMFCIVSSKYVMTRVHFFFLFLFFSVIDLLVIKKMFHCFNVNSIPIIL